MNTKFKVVTDVTARDCDGSHELPTVEETLSYDELSLKLGRAVIRHGKCAPIEDVDVVGTTLIFSHLTDEGFSCTVIYFRELETDGDVK